MSDDTDTGSLGASGSVGAAAAPLRTSTPIILYVLNLAALVAGITAVIAIVWAYVAQGELRGTWAESHLTWTIRTFWLGLLSIVVYALVSMLLLLIPLLGWAAIWLIGLWLVVWWIARHVKGLLRAARQEPIPDPQSWLF